MSANTVKLQPDLLRRIAGVKSRTQTIAAFVHEALDTELRRREMHRQAEGYQKLLRHQKLERQELEVWEQANLRRPVKRKRK